MVRLGLADGGQQLPAQTAGRLLARQGVRGPSVGLERDGRHAVDGRAAEVTGGRGERRGDLRPAGGDRRELGVVPAPGHAQLEHVRLERREAFRDRRSRLADLVGLVEGVLAGDLERRQAPDRLVEGQPQRGDEGQETGGVRRSVHVALDGVGPGLGHEAGLELLSAGGELGLGVTRALAGPEVAAGSGHRRPELLDLEVQRAQLDGQPVDRAVGPIRNIGRRGGRRGTGRAVRRGVRDRFGPGGGRDAREGQTPHHGGRDPDRPEGCAVPHRVEPRTAS